LSAPKTRPPASPPPSLRSLDVFVLRVVGFLILITIGASLLTYLLTRNRRYLTLAWQVLKYGMVMAIVVLTFILFERLVLVI
jgi:hypothetical protein